jgi:hypothetical protein
MGRAGSDQFDLPAGACSNFRMPFDKRKLSHYEYRSFYVRLRFHDDALSSNHYMVVLANPRAKVRGVICTHAAELQPCLVFA